LVERLTVNQEVAGSSPARGANYYIEVDSVAAVFGKSRWFGSMEVVKELLLSGVAFYQNAPLENLRVIKCHGRDGIYTHAMKALGAAL
jgi:hypothetical protein